jgi:hypothetical protein
MCSWSNLLCFVLPKLPIHLRSNVSEDSTTGDLSEYRFFLLTSEFSASEVKFSFSELLTRELSVAGVDNIGLQKHLPRASWVTFCAWEKSVLLGLRAGWLIFRFHV